jgi:UDP-glucose 4-epimerase
VVDTLRHGPGRFGADELSTFALCQTDIRDYEALQAVFDEHQPELVIHTAALHYIPECEAQPDVAISINTLGTANVLRACLPNTGFVFISTAAVYAPEDSPHVEGRSLVKPMDIYGLTKMHGEDYVHYWAKEKNLRAAIVRMFNIIGPGETNPHLLPAILAQLLQGKRTLGLGNCHPKRDYIDVSDAAAGVAAVALQLGEAPGVNVVNIGTGVSHSVYEVVETFERIIGEPITIEADSARIRSVDRPFLTANITKATQQFGWAPALTLQDSLSRLWLNPDIPSELLERS